MKRKLFLSLTLLGLTGIIGACSTNDKTANENDKIQVVTSFYPMYEFTKNVVGDEADVAMIISAGTEAHDFEPSAKDLKKIQDADVFVYNNENMETWVPAIETTLRDGDVTVVKATENIVLLPGSEEEHDHSEEEEGHSHELDPHVWLSPKLAMKEVEEIWDQLVEVYPDKEKIFTDNATAYLEKLSVLDEEYREKMDQAEQTTFVTQHASFGYLALEYGLTQVPIAGLSPDEEPSPARLAELKKYVKENNIQLIYFESNATDAIAKTLAKEADVELLILNTLEGLSDKEMEEGKDYISVMEDNLESLSKTTGSKDKATLTSESEKEKTVENGYFKDQEVEERPLSNWAGEWQSVYPLLLDDTLDQVFDYKAKLNQDKTAAEYKKEYDVGYKTDIKNIKITDKNMTFTDNSGKEFSSDYQSVGYKILDYEGGNRGVRYLFEATDPSSGAFKYVQFSDHTITNTEVEHYHIYFGNESQDDLLSELDNWPTYYKTNLTGLEIAQEMLSH